MLHSCKPVLQKEIIDKWVYKGKETNDLVKISKKQ
jgi:hypothetical protein